MNSSKTSLIAIAALFVSLHSQYCKADVFHYRDGRVVSGTVKSTEKKEVDGRQVTIWSVQTRSGAYLQVHSSDLKIGATGKDELNANERAYLEKIRAEDPQTADEHYALAGWCSTHALIDLSKAHYERALDIDPNHGPARAAAKYDKDENGRWVKLDIIMGERRGKVLYKGRIWRFPEEIAILERENKMKELMGDVKREWTSLNNRATLRSLSQDKQQEAINRLRQIQDPRAVGVFSDFLLNSRKPAPPHLRLAYVEVLGRFPNGAASLARAAVTDPETSVRNACLDALRKHGPNVPVPIFVSYLSNANNQLINRAAEGLAQFNPESAILPLIDALITTHEFAQGNGNDMNISGNGGLAMGGSKKVKRDLNNGSVLNTLSQITNQNHEYDKVKWRLWYASVYAKSARDLRRDL